MFDSDGLREEIRSRNDIVSVIDSYLRLQKKGNNYWGLCPFHNEKTPSFSVTASKQIFHCFGCGAGGDVFDFIMKYENFTFPEALKFLAERAGIKIPEQELSQESKRQADLKGSLLEINKQAAKYFYYQLVSPKGKTAYEYLIRRGLSEDTVKKFGLGFSNPYSDDLYKYLKGLGYKDELLKQSGLVAIDEKRGGMDKFWNRVMFPIMDINHRVIGFGGRVMGDAQPKYLNSPETLLFDKSRNLYALNFARASRKQYLLICEGYMDVIALHQAGFVNAVAALGTAFTAFHANLIKRYTHEVVLTFDSDGAGTQAALRAIPILKEAGLTVKVINMKPYKDPDEFIKALGAEEYQKRIDGAKNGFFFETDVLQTKYEMSDPEQKTRFVHETAGKLASIKDELERGFYIDAIAGTYQIDVEQLRRLVSKFGNQTMLGMSERKEVRSEAAAGRKASEDGITTSQRLMLTWLTEDPALFDKIRGLIGPEDFTEGIYHKVAALVFDQYEKEHAVIPTKIISCFQNEEERAEVAAIFFAEIRGEMDVAARNKALSDVVMRLKEYSLDKRSQKAAEINDMELLTRIFQEQRELKNKRFTFDS